MVGNLVGDSPRAGGFHRPGQPLYQVAVHNSDGTPTPDGEVGELVILQREDRPQYGIFMGYGSALDGSTVWQDGVYHTTTWSPGTRTAISTTSAAPTTSSRAAATGSAPFEVESVLMEHPAVMECAVTGIPDPGRGYALKASIVLSPGFPRRRRPEKGAQPLLPGQSGGLQAAPLHRLRRPAPQRPSAAKSAGRKSGRRTRPGKRRQPLIFLPALDRAFVLV